MQFFNTFISDEAKENIKKVLDSTYISAGENAKNFELEFAFILVQNALWINATRR